MQHYKSNSHKFICNTCLEYSFGFYAPETLYCSSLEYLQSESKFYYDIYISVSTNSATVATNIV